MVTRGSKTSTYYLPTEQRLVSRMLLNLKSPNVKKGGHPPSLPSFGCRFNWHSSAQETVMVQRTTFNQQPSFNNCNGMTIVNINDFILYLPYTLKSYNYRLIDFNYTESCLHHTFAKPNQRALGRFRSRQCQEQRHQFSKVWCADTWGKS